MKVSTASARNALQTGLVRDDEPCTSVIDQLPVPQRLSDTCHTWTVNAEHPCNMLVRQLEFFPAASFMKRQKPTAEPLFHRVKRIADHTLGKLPDLTVDVVVQSRLQTLIGHHFPLEHIAGDRQRASGYADLHAICRTARIERGGDTDRSFVSDYADLYGPAVLEYLKFRDHGRLRKVNKVYLVILLVQVLVPGEVHSFNELHQPQKMFGIDKLQKRVGRCSKRKGIRIDGKARDPV
jgi:hypothetical protein